MYKHPGKVHRYFFKSCLVHFLWNFMGMTAKESRPTLIKSTLVQVMAWCNQATGYYQKQRWPRSRLSYIVTRPQCVNLFAIRSAWIIEVVPTPQMLSVQYSEPRIKSPFHETTREWWRLVTPPVLILWRHQMEIFSALLALCEGNSPVTGEFPSQRASNAGFDVFFDVNL